MAFWTLMAKLGLDTTQYQAGMKRAESLTTQFSNRIGGVMAARVGALFSIASVSMFARSVVDLSAKTKDLADQWGVTSDQVQKVVKAAKEIGLEGGDVGAMMQRIAMIRAQVLEGGKEGADKASQLAKLNVSLKDIVDPSKNSLSLFLKMGEALRGVDATSEQATAAMDILGKSGLKATAIMESLANQGPIELISTENIDKIDTSTEKLEEAWRRLKLAATPAIATAVDKAAVMAEALRRKVENPDLTMKQIGQQMGKEAASEMIRKELETNPPWFKPPGYKQEVDDKASDLSNRLQDAGSSQTKLSSSKSRASSVLAIDPLAKIGGLFLGADAAMRSLGEKQLGEAKKANRHLEKISGALSKPVA